MACMSILQAASLDETHPFFGLFGVATWDSSESAVVLISADGTSWVHTGDGRIRSGTWRMDAKDDICLIVGGVFEGCFTTTREGTTVRFANARIEFTLEPRNDLSTDFLTDAQRGLFTVMTASKGALETDRGGDEYIYLYEDGLITVIQPEGWVKLGSWWFTHNGRLCDDVNGVADCYNIRSVSDELVLLDVIQEGGDDIELKIRMSARSHLPPR
jgi:hypothetical protein